MKIKCILLSIFFIPIVAFAQTINMEFPALAGKTYDFIIFQGSKIETISKDTIPQNGKFKLSIPKQYAPYTGMGRWLITGTKEGGGLDLTIPGYDFAVSSQSDQPNSTNTEYINYNSINEFYDLLGQQNKIIEKYESVKNAKYAYQDQKKWVKRFDKEMLKQQVAFEQFKNDLEKNPSYNARFLPIINLTKAIPPYLTEDANQTALDVNEFICQDLNFKDLFVSGHWQSIIKSWVVLQINVINDTDIFAKDFKRISDRINDQKIYTDFIENITHYASLYGKDEYVNAITPTVLNSGLITAYSGVLQVYQKALIGSKAPDLVFTEHIGKLEDHNHSTTILKSNELATENYKNTLLVFYQSGCGPCQELMQKLPQLYADLKKKGIRIISISADEGELLYYNSSRDYPWQDKYCDFEGIKGVNFTNYGVDGTPTLYLLDSQGMILQKFASAKQLLEWLAKAST